MGQCVDRAFFLTIPFKGQRYDSALPPSGTQLAGHLEKELQNTKSPAERFIIARDQAYFKAAFFSGDRPRDLGQVKVPEILRFPNDDGFLCLESAGIPIRGSVL